MRLPLHPETDRPPYPVDQEGRGKAHASARGVGSAGRRGRWGTPTTSSGRRVSEKGHGLVTNEAPKRASRTFFGLILDR